ncbi:hypothetical protein FRC12_023056, partial [Ceratobasidium sp. 428]
EVIVIVTAGMIAYCVAENEETCDAVVATEFGAMIEEMLVSTTDEELVAAPP